ncbi:MAG: fused MFS/spermidine synthase [Saprospiraceae bacterium]
MANGFFQKWWSYLKDVHIETIPSQYNKQLDLWLVKGRYQLCTANAIYSYGDKYHNFRLSFEKMKLGDKDLNDVLLLGFGLGSIPFMLEKVFGKKYNYTGIEIDESVIRLASQYVINDLSSEISLVKADAYHFVHQTSEKYDLICMDIFIDNKIPEIFLSHEFLKALTKILSKNGIVMFNHIGYTSEELAFANAHFKKVFSIVFPKATKLVVNGNVMMFNDGDVLK